MLSIDQVNHALTRLHLTHLNVQGAKKKAVVSAKGKKSAAIKEEVMERELSVS